MHGMNNMKVINDQPKRISHNYRNTKESAITIGTPNIQP